MAISVTTDLSDVNLSEATTSYAVIGTWATGIAASPDTYVQSSNTVGGRCSANSAWAHTSMPGGTPVDLSINERHIFQWLKCISIPQLDSKANGGLGITISSDATPTLTGVSPSNGPTNSKTWYVGGNEDATSGWRCFVIDPQSTPSLTLGSPDVTGVQRIGIRAKMVGTVGGGAVKPVNIVFDATRYGTGLTYTGDDAGTPGTFADILTTAMDSANAWGIHTKADDIYFGAGKYDFGTTGQTATSSFKETGQLFVWRNFPVANTFYAWRIRGAAAFATSFQLGNYAGGLSSDGCTVKGAGDPSSSTHAVWTIDVGTNTTASIYGSQLSELRRTTLQSNSVIRDTTIKNFGDITANGATLADCTFQDLKTTAPISAAYAIQVATTAPTLTNNLFVNCATAIYWNVNADTNTKLDGTGFVSGGTGHAIELGPNTPISITLADVPFTGYGGTPGSNPTENSGSTDAAIYNNSGKTITINIVGGTTPAVRNGAGATTVIVANTVTLTITAIDVNTAAAIVGARVLCLAAAGGDLPADEVITISRSGSTATVAHTGHGLSTGNQVRIKGAVEYDYNGIYTITVTGVDAYTYAVANSPSTPATGTIVSSAVIISALTNGSGVASDTRTYSADQPVTGTVKRGGTTSPYKSAPIAGEVKSASGGDITISMIPDTG